MQLKVAAKRFDDCCLEHHSTFTATALSRPAAAADHGRAKWKEPDPEEAESITRCGGDRHPMGHSRPSGRFGRHGEQDVLPFLAVSCLAIASDASRSGRISKGASSASRRYHFLVV